MPDMLAATEGIYFQMECVTLCMKYVFFICIDLRKKTDIYSP